MEEAVQFKLNGKPTKLTVDNERKLLWVLRTDLGLTGTKYGCGENFCGACTVLVNNEAMRSCQSTVKAVQGKEVVTIEGLAKNGTYINRSILRIPSQEPPTVSPTNRQRDG